MKQMDADQLLRDVSGHVLTVEEDDGLYRHLHFAHPKISNLWFDLIPWPGNLTIHGDMGTWSFSRIENMFEFFRSKDLKIDTSYWDEKVTSESRFGGPSRKFSPETFRANVLSDLNNYELGEAEKAEIVEELGDEVFGEEHEATARRALDDFEHGDFKFFDTWELNGDDYTYHFIWCLYAIVWAIQKYDAVKAAEGESE